MPAGDVTLLLKRWTGGDAAALDELMPLVYDELRRMAGRALRQERTGHTLGSTALVHEAYLRLVGQDRTRWQNRAQFFAVAAQAMRRILVDHARRRHAAKRGSGGERIELDEELVMPVERAKDLVVLDDLLGHLSTFDERKARIVEMRFFGGMSVDDISEVLGLGPSLIRKEWETARMWLYREMASDATDGSAALE